MSWKKCPKCGTRFRCEGDKDCWCEQVNLHRAELLEILERYTDCICPGCLSEYEAEQ